MLFFRVCLQIEKILTFLISHAIIEAEQCKKIY